MPPPDLSGYVDLTIYDKTPQQVFELAMAELLVRVPELVPVEGSIEVQLLEAIAQQVAEAVYAINRIPGAVTQILLQLYGVDRFEGQEPQADITFNLSDTQGHVLPAGTRVVLDLGVDEPVVFTTTVAGIANPGDATITVSALGDRFTDQANGVAAGTGLTLVDTVFFVDSAVLATVPIEGASPEDNATWLDRGTAVLGRLSATLALPEAFTNAALENPLIFRATTLDNYDPTADVAGDGPVGNDPGHVTVAVYGTNGPVSAGDKAALQATLDSQALANLAVHVIDATINAENVTVHVVKAAGYSDAQVTADVQAAVAALLTPDAWPWDTVLRRNLLISTIGSLTSVAYVATLTTPAADVNLTGVAPLVSLAAPATVVIDG